MGQESGTTIWPVELAIPSPSSRFLIASDSSAIGAGFIRNRGENRISSVRAILKLAYRRAGLDSLYHKGP